MLFPGKISVEECAKLPPAVVMTSEYDLIRRDAKDLISKLKEAGTYLDHMDYAGVHHGFESHISLP